MEDKIECIGKGVFTLIMGLICLTMAIYLLIITDISHIFFANNIFFIVLEK